MDDYEDLFSHQEKRESRLERKRLRAKDRSQYKKTDQDQKNRAAAPLFSEDNGECVGRVTAIAGEKVSVAYGESTTICTWRGSLKLEQQRKKSLLAVGDIVRFLPQDASIHAIEPRRSQLSRADNLSRQREQLIAANVDLVLITVSVVAPSLNLPIIDRYLIAARQGNMEALVLINKIDLLTEEETPLYREALDAYNKAHIPILSVSAITNEGVDELKAHMEGKLSVFSGQSGVGKSSLINLLTGEVQATRSAVARTGKGAHTTTQAQLLPLLGMPSSWVIDTPGIRSFGLWQLRREDLPTHFPEIAAFSQHCYFADCTHTHEAHCAVIDAVEAGNIHPLRYASYCSLLEESFQQHRRR